MNAPAHVSMDSRTALREQDRQRIQRETEEFLARGGKVRFAAPGEGEATRPACAVMRIASRQQKAREKAIQKINAGRAPE